jgi:hypothetical protein
VFVPLCASVPGDLATALPVEVAWPAEQQEVIEWTDQRVAVLDTEPVMHFLGAVISSRDGPRIDPKL